MLRPAFTGDGKNQTVKGHMSRTKILFHHPLSTASVVCSNQRMNVTMIITKPARKMIREKQLMASAR